ncbi:fibronectin type III domain-containing protein [Holophaga foetida]|uniref:fibronectin type III domain-containing protein n=1 Tax=Holophaga foetida TaxID=35839 RepID=UPI000247465B
MSKVYTGVLSSQTAQDYVATAITYTISGNAGVGGATLTYTDGAPKTATADSSGNYSFTVSYNWSGTVTLTKTGYTFTPASKAYSSVLSNQAAQDYVGTAITYTISGNTGVGGATLAYADGGAKTATADSNGNYSFTVSYNWSGSLTPSKAGFSFSPTSRSFVNVLNDQGGTAFTAALSAPSSPQASAISGTGFVAGWDSNPAATGYLLDVSASSTFTSFLDGFHDLSVTELFATVTSLKPATTYYFRVRAKSSSHTSEYAVSSGIATSAIAPDATTLAADGVTPTSATLNASVNAQNSSTTVTFEYGPTALLGFSVTATLSPVTGMSDTQVSAQLSNLAPLTQYYFRVVAENAGGPAAGSLLNFTTPHMPAVLVQTVSPSSAPVGKVITVSGSGFTGATSVVLGGMEAIFTVVSDTELSCIVPPGAITGVIKVSSPAGTGESADAFTVEMEG